jgi:hypothetical protein
MSQPLMIRKWEKIQKISIDERGRDANKIYKRVIDYNRCSPQDRKILGGKNSFSRGHDEGVETGFRNFQPPRP